MRFGPILMLSITTLWAAGAAAQSGSHQPYAAQAEGYIGGTAFDIDGAGNEGGFTGGGTGSVVGLLGPGYAQLDIFGDKTDPSGPSFSSVGVGGHLGLSDPEVGFVGFTWSYQEIDLGPVDEDFARVGGAAEVYLDRFTLGLHGGVFGQKNEDVDDFYYLRGIARMYPMPELKIEGVGGYADLTRDTGLARVLVEYRPETWWASFFVRWEASFNDDINQHAAVAGVRVFFDTRKSLRDSDRVYFRDRCIGLIVGTRFC